MNTDNRPFVFLDIDNTILDFDTAEKHALRYAFGEMGVPCTDEMLKRYTVINIEHWEKLENGLMSRADVMVKRFEALYREYGFSADAAKTNDIYEKRLAIGHWFMPGAEEMLAELSAFCRLFICSNGASAVQAGRIESAGIAKYFEGIFVSEDMGCDKPSREYFDLCFSRIPDFDRDRAIIVGDSLTSDIRGGINAGIKTCWYNPKHRENTGTIRPDYETDELGKVAGIVRDLERNNISH